jgi:hypothetical protein
MRTPVCMQRGDPANRSSRPETMPTTFARLTRAQGLHRTGYEHRGMSSLCEMGQRPIPPPTW